MSLALKLCVVCLFEVTNLGLTRKWSLDENPSCWTGGYTYDICCNEAGGAAGCWGEDADNVPHKRDRCCTSPCGHWLRQKIHASTGNSLCSGMSARSTTLVTGLWNLRREKWASHSRYKEGAERSYSKYLHWLDILLMKPEAMVLFLDQEAAAFASPRRDAHGLSNLTCLVETSLEELPQMKWRDAYFSAHAENRRQLPKETQPEVIHAEYTLAVNSKPELLGCAALWNPFQSERFAWVDAGVGRKDGFPKGNAPIILPSCSPWSLCVGRRSWLFFDFRSKLKRLQHGSTFDSTVLLGGAEGVLLYVLWFQWAIARYLSENVMDDEQSVIAEVWWAGIFEIKSFYGMTWAETTTHMLQAGSLPEPSIAGQSSIDLSWKMGRWFLDHPYLIQRNTGSIWIPFPFNLRIAETVTVNEITDEHLERIAFAHWCLNDKYEYYKAFCDNYAVAEADYSVENLEHIPIISGEQTLVWQT